jgi:hypothetical protein
VTDQTIRPAYSKWPEYNRALRDHVLGADQLVHALDTTFRIVEACPDRWTLDMLDEELRRPEWPGTWVYPRGAVIQRVFAHDVYHCAELNETLGTAELPQIDLWD